ncbi:MAG: carboxylating nicotinate-nucleotide diphosphorylase [candidate division Zixibacteria bacterium]|nr:carboxylating nicotinate-nucleotide diphosphorylase [candidate division Zixibacteria bacterium]
MDPYYKFMIQLVKAALDEDIGRGDLTSFGALEPGPAHARIVAKCDGVLSGVEPALLVFETVDSANTVVFTKKDGERFVRGDIIAEIDGFNQTLLSSERAALNFLGHLSGVATKTAAFVEKVRGTSVRILDTRKTLPGWRHLEKRAVVHGGGMNHRAGLYDMVLIKDNHIASAGSVTQAVGAVRDFMQTPDFRLQFEARAEEILIEVEVENDKQLREAIAAGVDRLLLDNQSTESLKQLVATARGLNPSIQLEASGNIALDNVAETARTGVDFISVGAITHSAPVADFSMKFLD